MIDPALAAAAHGRVEQTEIVADLFRARFEAVTTVGEAFEGCLLGLGVAEALDGEVVAFDGETWRVRADGHPVPAPVGLGLPFAVAAFGSRALEVSVREGDDIDALSAVVAGVLADAGIDDAAHVAAVRLDGRFGDVLLHSEHRQDPPYDPLPEVLEHEVRFEFPEWEGTLVGFRSPELDNGLVIPGMHLHGVSAKRDSGGHCREVTVLEARMQLWLDDLSITVPHDGVAAALARDVDDAGTG